ncbi:MAG: HesA/MoeB/ThiF family protein [Chromatiales bacterium]|nr:HesA/MoeB/ThiF family protein [Chromatiales bacterium]
MSGTDARLRYSRHLALPQFAGDAQDRLASARVLILGLGGLGSPASLYLAGAGVGRLLLNDFDRVDASNLPRQLLYREADCGEPKAVAAARALAAVNPDVRCEPIDRRLSPDELASTIAGCDLVLDCCDNFATRVALSAACIAQARPLVSGAAIRWEGQVAVFRHDRERGPCYRCLYTEEDENLANCAGQGILAPVAGTVGTMMATEALKILLGLDSGLRNHLWTWDALAGQSRRIRINRRANCPACHE